MPSLLKPGAAALLAAVLLGAAGMAAACEPMVEASAEDGRLDLHLRFACAPYQPVEIRYGPLHLSEETGARGDLHVALPVLPPSAELSVEAAGGRHVIARPDGAAAGGFLWIDPQGTQPGLLPVAGFPVAGAALPELALYGAAEPPARVDLAVTAENCGRRLDFGLMRSGWDAPRPAVLEMPGCEMAGTVLRLPVPAE
ncbi:hypothetical protein [Poseidonocella sp. HB161398]|uniref:hypothetical protein n=1 Tax=Poseidonocella sp. HB161398 TaxID=2320855 RepID=UPI001108156E|nr:hypothetical protein [Poseidonocella sp. HB161398]